ncbi:MAG: TetR/AcrR family transcriptional regulator [Clostridia bacterium]|nr:TetR/AcrR family transcriptional regulator [Clostridia bacterium]
MKREIKKEQTRERIMEAIFSLMEEKSWRDISSNEICQRADISKRTLYIYFRSQDEMYLELVRDSFIEFGRCLSLAFEKGETIEDKVVSMGIAYLEFMVENPIKGGLMMGFNEKMYGEEHEQRISEIRKIANEFELSNVFGEQDGLDRNTAVFLWAYIQGIAQLILNKDKWMEEYYGMSVSEIIDNQMKLVRKFITGVNI